MQFFLTIHIVYIFLHGKRMRGVSFKYLRSSKIGAQICHSEVASGILFILPGY